MKDASIISRRARFLCGAALVAAGLNLAATASAQTAAPGVPAAEATADDEKEIVVTGSRIKRAEFDASTPVSVLSAEDVKLAGTVNVEKLLSDSPQFVGSQNGGATSNTVPGGTADVNLRGFGATRNLVLVNGRRFAIYGPDQVTDLNTIPTSLIARTEIVTGGSSAVYGSDAITGVVNFIMRDDFEGVEAKAQLNLATPTGTPTYNFDVTLGGNFADGRGNLVVSGNYLRRKAISRGERGDFAFDSLSDGCVVAGTGSANSAGRPLAIPGGQTCTSAGGQLGFIAGGSGDIPNGRFSTSNTFGTNPALDAAYTAAGLTGLGARGFTFNDSGTTARLALTPQDDFNLGPDNYLIVPQERWMINSFGHYDFSDNITGYMELHYSNNLVSAQLAPSNVGVPTLFDVNNPYLTPQLREVFRQLDLAEPTTPTVVTSGSATRSTTRGDGLAVITAGRRYLEVGRRLSDARRNTFRGAWGFRGDLGSASDSFLTDLSYDVYYTYARTEETTLLRNAISRSRLQASLLSVGGAAPVCNIFGQNITAACASAISISATNSTMAELQVASANITGNLFSLPAGPVGFSTGVEWRESSAKFNPDSFLSSGDVAGFNPGLPTSGSVSAKEVFGEIRVPLIHNTPFIDSLTANAAFRYSDYSLSGIGGVWTYLGGLDWRVSKDIAFRGQYQRAIRAPNVNELFGGTSRSVGTATDPCGSRVTLTDAQKAVLRPVCEATGVPASLVFGPGVQPEPIIPADFGGNPAVGAEKSDTFTAGVVLTPSFIKGLYISVDYFNITLDGAISPLGGGLANTLNLCYNVLRDPNSEFCKAIRRNPTSGAIQDPFVAQIRNANTGSLKTSGIDFQARYHLEAGFGFPGLSETSSFDFSTNWTWLDEFTSTPVAAFPNIKNFCAGAYGTTCGQPLPKWRGNSRVTWNLGDLSLSVRHRYIGEVTTDRYLLPLRSGAANAPPITNFAYPVLKAQNYIDLSFTLDVMKNLQFYGGANNVFGKQPPVSTQGPGANTFAATYDVIGTEVFFGATVKF